MFLIIPFALLFWALPATLMLINGWRSYAVTLTILIVIVAYFTGALDYILGARNGSCVQGSCDGGMVVSAIHMMLDPAWLSLIACAVLKALALRDNR